MSGIAVVYRGDGGPAPTGMLDRMLQAIRHRGPDGMHRWHAGEIGLGQARLHTTPESLREHAPISADGCRIVWDGRLDNREELCVALNAAGIACGEPTEAAPSTLPRECRSPVGLRPTDPELALGAYRYWGERCAEHILGDFAFVIWDQRARVLFGARDRIGLRPFYYMQRGGTLFIASEAKGLLAVMERRPDPDDEMVIATLLAECREPDHHRSLFASIRRLPPAHSLIAKDGALQLRRYWQLDPAKRTVYQEPQDYVDHFRTLFEDAVRCRTRSAFPVGCVLSGGLDSSSITMLAARHASRVEAFTVFAQRALTDERVFSRAVCEVAGIPLWEFSGMRPDALEDLDALLWQVECPLIVPDRMSPAFSELIRSRNCRVMLHGDAGDHLLDELGYLADLLVRANPVRFLRETRAFAQWYGAPTREFFESAIKDALPTPVRSMLKRTVRSAPLPWLNSALAQRIKLAQRIGTPRSPIEFRSHGQRLVYEEVLSPYFLIRLEQAEREVAQAGQELWYPYLDSRLIEFVCSIPWDQRCHNGQRKWLLRHAMVGALPDAVRLRRGKGDWTQETDDSLAPLCRRDPPEPLANRSGMMGRYVDWRRAEKLVRQYLQGNRSLRWDVWSLVVLDHWCQQFWERGGDGDVGEKAVQQEAVRAAEAALLR